MTRKGVKSGLVTEKRTPEEVSITSLWLAKGKEGEVATVESHT